MADISITSSFNLTKGTLKRSYSRNDTVDFVAAAPTVASGCASIGATQEAIPLQDVTTLGWARFENLDTAYYIEIGVYISSVFYPIIKLLPGEFVFTRLASAAVPYARASSSSAILDYEIFQA